MTNAVTDVIDALRSIDPNDTTDTVKALGAGDDALEREYRGRLQAEHERDSAIQDLAHREQYWTQFNHVPKGALEPTAECTHANFEMYPVSFGSVAWCKDCGCFHDSELWKHPNRKSEG